jgi:hypothetical protein
VQEELHRAKVTRWRLEEGLMGLMDKAKKLAEQAQQKLDEAQQQFNSGGQTQGQQPGGGIRYDEHGRPIDAPPAADAPPPTGQPPAEPDSSEPAASEPAPPPPEGTNANPDPFKPIQ